jgi:acetyl-CoA acetyltransferase
VLTIRNQVAVIGVGYSDVQRRSSRPLGALAVEAAERAAEDAGLSVSNIDGLSVYWAQPFQGSGDVEGVHHVSVGYMARTLQLPDVRWNCQVGPASFVSSLIEAVNAVAAGACEYALIWRALHNPPGRYSRTTVERARGEREFTAPYGLSVAGMFNAIPYSRYMAKYGATREHMASFIVNNRHNAALNPDAVFYRKPVTRDEYLNDRRFADPISYLDSDMPVDGAGAVIVTAADRAKDFRQSPVYVVGYSCAGGRSANHPLRTLEVMQETASQVGQTLWENTGLHAGAVDQPNLYDGFSYFTYLWLEGLGFCKEGEAFEFIQEGRIATDGVLPLNTSGGSLGMGRLHGSPQVIESVLQLQHRAADRQVGEPVISLAVTGSLMGTVGAMLFTSDRDA